MLDGELHLRLRQALLRDDCRHDLVLQLPVRGGVFPREARGEAATFNARYHDVTIESAEPDGAGGWALQVRVYVHSDPWVRGGRAAYRVQVRRGDGHLVGEWTGTCRDVPLTGEVTGEVQPFWVPRLTVATAEPAILRDFAERGAAARLPDFSFAGCGRGERPPPSIEGPVFRVEDFGARPGSGADATAAVQRAADAAAAAGGGVVLLPPGRFEWALDDDRACVELRSGVVIRGAGSGPGGTELFAHRPGRSPEPGKLWRANEYPRFFHAGPESAPRLGGYGPPAMSLAARLRAGERGARFVEAERAGRVKAGDVLLLMQREDATGSLARALVAPSTRLAENYLGPDRPLVRQTVRVAAVDGDVLWLDTPLRWPVRPEWSPALWSIATVRGCGVERLRLSTAWNEVFDHHKNDIHDNGWDAIRFDGVVDGWVRDVVFDSVSTAVGLPGCLHCTVMDCRIEGNPGHNGFGAGAAASDNLFLRCHAGRQMHAFSLEGAPSGNVFLDCSADEPSGIDLHGGVGLANLFDGLRGCVQRGGGSERNAPPRHAHGFALWNWQTGLFDPYVPTRERREIADWEEMAGFLAVGVRARDLRPLHYRGPDGETRADAAGPWGHVEALNALVEPRSLHRWQLARRLGSLPEWLQT